MADRIVQPKVLASTNPDTYDNLIMQQAQNSTNVTTTINGNAISDIFENNGTVVKNAINAASATNGIFTQTFSSYSDFYSWYDSQDSNLIVAHFQFTPRIELNNVTEFSISTDAISWASSPVSGYDLRNLDIINNLCNPSILYTSGGRFASLEGSMSCNITRTGIQIEGMASRQSFESSFTGFIYARFNETISSTNTMSITVSYFIA